jgi:hypothetical protein
VPLFRFGFISKVSLRKPSRKYLSKVRKKNIFLFLFLKKKESIETIRLALLNKRKVKKKIFEIAKNKWKRIFFFKIFYAFKKRALHR